MAKSMGMDTLVGWKRRRDLFQSSDNVSGMGDQVDCFEDMENPDLVGNPMDVKFIMKDETNAEVMRHLKIKPWW